MTFSSRYVLSQSSKVAFLNSKKVETEPIRIDEMTQKRFTFIADPDELPIEFYER
jgi:glyoxylase I family protein